MATSRTGTAKWKAVRAKVIRDAQRQGIEHCPMCGILLDYTPGIRARNSVEVDHIVPHSQGGRDEASQCQVLCGRCNRRLSDKRTKTTKNKQKASSSVKLQTSRAW